MNSFLKKTIFQQDKQIDEMEQKDEQDEIELENKKKLLDLMKKQLRQILYNKQNVYRKENLINLRNRKLLEGFAEEIPSAVQQCFYFFSQALANARSLRVLDISGMDLHPLLTIEIGIGLQHNASLRELHMGSCKLNSFCLQYIFSSITNHKTLQVLNLFNNQGFTIDLMNDLNQFVFKGKNHLKKLKLTHCNISTTAMSYLLRNVKYSKTLTQLDFSMIHFNTEVLTSLGIALQHFKGEKILEYLNISDTNIRNDGLETLAQRVDWNIRKINLKELLLRQNQISQNGVSALETFLRKIAQLQKLDLSCNKIEEFTCQDLHSRKMYEVNLVKNLISIFPQFFFMNTLVINLSNNNISSQGAFQLSSILRQNPLWIELNLTSNNLQSEGFNSLIFGLRDNRMLKRLIVADNNLDGEAIVCYMINHEQVQFEFLDISLNQIRQQLIFVLLNYIKSGNLRALRCSYLQGEEVYKKVDHNLFFMRQDEYQLKQNNQVFQLTSFNLIELDFHGNKDIFSTVVYSLSTYFNKIEKLNLSSCSPIQDQDVEQLCQFLRKSTMIRDLNLSNLNLGSLLNETIKKLSDAIQMSSLKYLNLSRNRLYKQLKRLFSLKNQGQNFRLEGLDLSFNCLEGKHIKYIEKMLTSFRNLQDINLSHNWLNFECLFAINRALQTNKSIIRLNLSYQKLSADDLLILSQTLGTESLQELNISNNLYTTKLKTFFNQCSTQRQDYLNFQHIYFDDANFQSLQTIIKNQKRNLQGITLDSCFFKSGTYTKLITQICKSKKLEYFSIIYNPTLDKELGNIIDKIPKFKVLKVLRFNQVSLTWTYIQGVAEFLAKHSCNLVTVDLSSNKIQQDWLETLCKGIAKNSTLKQLMLNNCNLGNFDLSCLGDAIRLNKSVEILELASNKISDNLLPFLNRIKVSESYNILRELNLADNPLNNQSVVGIFLPCPNNQERFLNIQYLNLTNCKLQQSLFNEMLEVSLQYKEQLPFSKIQSLCLCNNQLNDESGPILKQIISRTPSLRELTLSDNQISSEGCVSIMEGILENETVRKLDIQNNQICDSMIFQMAPKFLSTQLKNLEFLLLRKNNFSKQGQKKLVEITSFQSKLFIDNIWSELDDDDGEVILKQYTKVGQTYRLDQHSVPTFLREIFILNAELTDKFCELLAKYYPMLNFVEFIDISDNPYITMYGKVYLFIHLFDQSFGRHQLKALYIADSQETRKLFDDGLLRYLLLRFRNFLYPPKVFGVKSATSQREVFRSSSELDGKQVVQKIIGGLCGSWILHKINKLMTYLDQIEPPQFIVSTLFIGKFRTNNIYLKTLVAFFLLFAIIISSIQFGRGFFSNNSNPSYELTKKLFNEQCVRDDQLICENFDSGNLNNDIMYFVCIFAFTLFVELVQLGIGIYIRRKIQPAFQIVHPLLMKYLHSPYPHNKEILLMIQSFLGKISNAPERILLYYISSLTKDGIEIRKKNISLNILSIILMTIVSLRYFEYIIMIIRNNIRFLRMTPREDQAKYLQLLQRKMFYESYYIISDILVALCPVKGYRITKAIVINEEILIAFWRIFVFEIIQIVLLCFIYQEYKYLLDHEFFGIDPYGFTQGWIILALCKSVLSIIAQLFRILTVRPAVVKQHGFNQALTIKKFYENRSQFVIPSHIKIEYEVSESEKQLDRIDEQEIIIKKPILEQQISYDPEKQEFKKSKMDEIQEVEDKEEGNEEGNEDEHSIEDNIVRDEENQSILRSEHSYGYETPAGHLKSSARLKFKFTI